jgi:hypothetical protein
MWGCWWQNRFGFLFIVLDEKDIGELDVASTKAQQGFDHCRQR